MIQYAGSTKTVKLVVLKGVPKVTAKAKTFKRTDRTKKYTVSLTYNKKAVNGVKVTIKVGKKTYSAFTKKGVATFKLTKLTKKGRYAATVTSLATKYYAAKAVKTTITIK